MQQTQVYIACSLDGFIAGPDDDLSWLPGATADSPALAGPTDPGAVDYPEFMAGIGAILMGRNTYDVVCGFGGPWPYQVPVVVATTRAAEARPGVTFAKGDIEALLETAAGLAGEGDIYLDGGRLIRQALDADRVDAMTLTMVPVVLGTGAPLFAGVQRRWFEVHGCARYLGMAQLVLRRVSG